MGDEKDEKDYSMDYSMDEKDSMDYSMGDEKDEKDYSMDYSKDEKSGTCVGEIDSVNEYCSDFMDQESCESAGKSPFSDGVCDWIEGSMDESMSMDYSMDYSMGDEKDEKDYSMDYSMEDSMDYST